MPGKLSTIAMSLSCTSTPFFILWLINVQCSAHTFFIFGDSLVDAGNNNYIITLAKANTPPYGIDFLASGRKPTGRFTNGMTVSDIIGKELGSKSFVPPFSAPAAHGLAIIGGVNYASGASGILEQTGALFMGRISLRTQIDNFEKTREELVGMMGEDGCSQLLQKGTFSITTGSNDILNYITPPLPFVAENKVSPAVLQESMVTNMAVQLKRLHGMGARKFVVSGVGPLGCIPLIRALNLGSCWPFPNEVARGYNEKLVAVLDGMNKEMGNSSVFLYLNAYDALNDIIENHREYGFDHVGEACCGGIMCEKGRGNYATTNGTGICNDRSKYVFWDAYHPTEASNIIVAEKFSDGDTRFAAPFNIRFLENGWTGIPDA